MKTMKSICSYPGCNTLIDKPGRCDKHPTENPFKKLDNKKTSEDKKFYGSSRWRKTSIEHRKIEPLCRECKGDHIIKAGQMVHHEPDRKKLIKLGLSPYDHKYLVTLCNQCHLKHLRAKKTN